MIGEEKLDCLEPTAEATGNVDTSGNWGSKVQVTTHCYMNGVVTHLFEVKANRHAQTTFCLCTAVGWLVISQLN